MTTLRTLFAGAVLCAGVMACFGGDDGPEPATSTPIVAPESDATIDASSGGALELQDGARLEIPPDALPGDGSVSFEALTSSVGAPPFVMGVPLGKVYRVDFGTLDLRRPAQVEIPLDRATLPDGAPVESAFLAAMVETTGTWSFAGGTVDPAAGTIRLAFTPPSLLKTATAGGAQFDTSILLQPSAWNLDAAMAILKKTLTLEIGNLLDAGKLLLEGCNQADPVAVDSSGSNDLIQGCNDGGDGDERFVRAVNQNAFYLTMKARHNGTAWGESVVLADGEAERYPVYLGISGEITVTGAVDEVATAFLVADSVLQILGPMLPADIGFNANFISCGVRKTYNDPYIQRAARAVYVDHDAVAARDHILALLDDVEAASEWHAALKGCSSDSFWNSLKLLPPQWAALEVLTAIGPPLLSGLELMVEFHKGITQGEIKFVWSAESRPNSDGGCDTPRASLQICSFDPRSPTPTPTVQDVAPPTSTPTPPPTLAPVNNDRDNDGIPNANDACPDQAENYNGYQDQNGCPDEPPAPDRDEDGIPDDNDECPDQAEDYDGTADQDGCPDIVVVNYSLSLTIEGYEFYQGDELEFCYHLSPENVAYTARLSVSGNFIREWEDNGNGGGDCLEILINEEASPGPRTLEIEAFVDGVQAGRATAPFEIVVEDGFPPAAPSDVFVDDVGSESFRIEWDDNSDNETGFEVSDCVPPLNTPPDCALFVQVGPGVTEYYWATPNLSYKCFAVRAYNQYGYSPWTPYSCLDLGW